MRTCTLFCLFLFLFPLGMFAQDVGEQTRRRQEIEREIAAIDKQIVSAQVEQKDKLRLLGLLQRKIDSRKRLLSDIDAQINQLGVVIREKQSEIAQLQEEYEALEVSYAQLLYKAYIYRSRPLWVAYVLASQDLRQAYRRWRYFQSYSESINRQAALMKQLRLRLDEEMEVLTKLRAETEVLREERLKELGALGVEERQSRQIITELSKQERTLKAQLQQKQREVERINKEIERILAEAEKRRKAATVQEQEVDRALAADFEQNRGKLPWPLRGGVVEAPFGQHNHPVFKNIKLPFNNGIGITAAKNDEVLSVFQGVVKQIVLVPGYNQCILIQHGLYYTFYCKLGSVKVKVGDKVGIGTALGTLAETDGAYSLHFELWKGTDKQNPELWLRKR